MGWRQWLMAILIPEGITELNSTIGSDRNVKIKRGVAVSTFWRIRWIYHFNFTWEFNDGIPLWHLEKPDYFSFFKNVYIWDSKLHFYVEFIILFFIQKWPKEEWNFGICKSRSFCHFANFQQILFILVPTITRKILIWNLLDFFVLGAPIIYASETRFLNTRLLRGGQTKKQLIKTVNKILTYDEKVTK